TATATADAGAPAATTASAPSGLPADGQPEIDQDNLLVRFQDGSAGPRRTALARVGGSDAGTVGSTGYVQVGVPGHGARAAIDRLRGDPGVADVQPNYVRRAAGADPPVNDPLFQKGAPQS